MSFTKAAQTLGLTQPCVSQHIKFLEQHYGVKLFSYSNRKLSLTDAGQQAYHCLLLLHDEEQSITEHIHLSAGKKRPLRLGATLSLGEYYLPARLATFMAKDSRLEVNVAIADTSELLGLLDEGSIDCALVEGYFDKGSYEYISLGQEEMVAVGGPTYKLTDADIFSCHLFVREPGSGTREVLERYLSERGFSIASFQQVSVINDIPLLLSLLRHNLGISFLYRLVVTEDLRRGTLRRIAIASQPISHELGLIWRKGSIFSEDYRSIAESIVACTTTQS
jgi:DNA-binding transcriptional LysR family regulator